MSKCKIYLSKNNNKTSQKCPGKCTLMGMPGFLLSHSKYSWDRHLVSSSAKDYTEGIKELLMCLQITNFASVVLDVQ